VRIHSWSPDGDWLLLELGSATAPSLVLLAHAAESVALNTVAASAFCEEDCVMGLHWDEARLWITWDSGTQGCLQATDTRDLAGPVKLLQPKDPVCQVGTIPLHPRSPRPAEPAWTGTESADAIAFLQPAVPGIWAGLYSYAPEGELTPLVLLPEADGTLLWAPGGDAFLYSDSQQVPVYLGTLTMPALWDVRELLNGAHSFTWSRSAARVGEE
jgi:hypothetical protein